MENIINHPALWLTVAFLSEVIALTPLKENSLIQLLFTALRAIKPKKS
jgi:hypothetical protein